jgi:general stress protein 26
MNSNRFEFEFVEKEVRKRTFGVLTTIDSKGRPHSTGILYGVAPPVSKFALYMLSVENYEKVKNIRRNPKTSLVITFPHHYLRFVPANYVMFRGTSEIVAFDDDDGQWAFRQHRILRFNIASSKEETLRNAVFIKLVPEPTLFCYGLGMSLMEIRKSHETGSYKVKIPEARLAP